VGRRHDRADDAAHHLHAAADLRERQGQRGAHRRRLRRPAPARRLGGRDWPLRLGAHALPGGGGHRRCRGDRRPPAALDRRARGRPAAERVLVGGGAAPQQLPAVHAGHAGARPGRLLHRGDLLLPARRDQGFGGTPMALKDEEKPAADEQRSEAKTEEPATEPATAAHAEEEAAASVEDATDRAAEAPAAKPAAGERTARPAPQQPRGAPGWIVPAYVTGLVLLYMGERILEASPTWRMVAVSAGLAAVLVATAARFVPSFRSGGERRDIERLLAVLSVTGLAALAMYLATTDFGSKLVGLSEAAYETRERVEGVLGVGWVMLLLISVVPMLFAETALRPMRQAERPESRRVRAAAAAGLTLVLAACYGALFVFVAGSTPVKADYSY